LEILIALIVGLNLHLKRDTVNPNKDVHRHNKKSNQRR